MGIINPIDSKFVVERGSTNGPVKPSTYSFAANTTDDEKLVVFLGRYWEKIRTSHRRLCHRHADEVRGAVRRRFGYGQQVALFGAASAAVVDVQDDGVDAQVGFGGQPVDLAGGVMGGHELGAGQQRVGQRVAVGVGRLGVVAVGPARVGLDDRHRDEYGRLVQLGQEDQVVGELDAVRVVEHGVDKTRHALGRQRIARQHLREVVIGRAVASRPDRLADRDRRVADVAHPDIKRIVRRILAHVADRQLGEQQIHPLVERRPRIQGRETGRNIEQQIHVPAGIVAAKHRHRRLGRLTIRIKGRHMEHIFAWQNVDLGEEVPSGIQDFHPDAVDQNGSDAVGACGLNSAEIRPISNGIAAEERCGICVEDRTVAGYGDDEIRRSRCEDSMVFVVLFVRFAHLALACPVIIRDNPDGVYVFGRNEDGHIFVFSGVQPPRRHGTTKQLPVFIRVGIVERHEDPGRNEQFATVTDSGRDRAFLVRSIRAQI
jgi:hypothetical protein